MKLDSHSNKKVLITGIDSFTGSHLKQNLEQSGFSVFGTFHRLKQSTANIYSCDVTDKSAVLNVIQQVEPNYVIHLAGISYVGHPVKEDFYKVNVLGTQNLLDALVETIGLSVNKVILASSATVYGNQGLEVLDESLCPQPANHYGMSKLAMEHMASTYFDKLPIIITRPFNYVGVGQPEHFVIPKIVKHFKERLPEIELGNTEVEREFNNISYACEVYKKLLLIPDNGVITNLCSGDGISLMSVIEIMQDIAGYSINVRVNPDFVRANELPRLVGSVNTLMELVGKQEKTSIEKTLRNMLFD